MTRADYSALAGTTTLTPPANVYCPPPANNLCVGSGSTSNQYLAPIRSNNYDASLEYYFAPRSILSATLFYMDLKNYIAYGSKTQTYLSFGSALPPAGLSVPYLLTYPINTQGRAEGIELAYQQAFGNNFGIDVNYTYTDAKQTEVVRCFQKRLQRQRLLRERALQCTCVVHLPLGVLQRPGSQHGVHAGFHRDSRRITGVYHERESQRDPGRSESEQSDAQVLRAQHGPAARLLPQREAVLPDVAREVLRTSLVRPGRAMAPAPAGRNLWRFRRREVHHLRAMDSP
jgi:hypothetical protein